MFMFYLLEVISIYKNIYSNIQSAQVTIVSALEPVRRPQTVATRITGSGTLASL